MGKNASVPSSTAISSTETVISPISTTISPTPPAPPQQRKQPEGVEKLGVQTPKHDTSNNEDGDEDEPGRRIETFGGGSEGERGVTPTTTKATPPSSASSLPAAAATSTRAEVVAKIEEDRIMNQDSDDQGLPKRSRCASAFVLFFPEV